MLSYPVPGDLLLISLHSSVGIHPGVSAPFDSNLTLARMTPKCIGVTLFECDNLQTLGYYFHLRVGSVGIVDCA